MKIIFFLIIFSYSGVVDVNNPRISSGFGDYRWRDVFHFHAGIDIGVKYGTKVKYPEGEDQYYNATIVSIRYGTDSWPNQTVCIYLFSDDKLDIYSYILKVSESFIKKCKHLSNNVLWLC